VNTFRGLMYGLLAELAAMALGATLIFVIYILLGGH
jgi:hypothetical protein